MSVIAAYVLPHPPLTVPGVGRGQERRIAATVDACTEVGRRIAKLEPDVVVIASPHATSYADYVHISPGMRASGDFANFGDPADEVETAYDAELARTIAYEAALMGIPAGTEGERDPDLDHATMVPLTFLQAQGVGCPIVRMGLSGLSGLDHYRLGIAVAHACERLDRRAVFVASGDLSHKLLESGPYGFAEAGPVFDKLVCTALSSGDFGALLALDPTLVQAAAQCGLNALLIMAGTLDGRAVDAELLSYEGPFGVGYAVAAFVPGAACASRCFAEVHEAREREALAQVRAAEDPWVQLARTTLESWVRHGKLPETTLELSEGRAGVFCSLHKNGELRGCMGTTEPTQPSVAREIQANVIAAGTRDPRFSPVTPDELDVLVYNVDVLGPLEPVDASTDLDPARYGVVVSTDDGRRGLLLPDLPGIASVEEQLAIARRKGGIAPNEPVQLARFEVVRHR